MCVDEHLAFDKGNSRHMHDVNRSGDVRRAQRGKQDKHRCVSTPEGKNNMWFMILNHIEERSETFFFLVQFIFCIA